MAQHLRTSLSRLFAHPSSSYSSLLPQHLQRFCLRGGEPNCLQNSILRQYYSSSPNPAYKTSPPPPPEVSSPNPNPPVPEKPSLFGRFKAMYKDYWYVLVPVHVITSIGWFGGFYYLVKSGVDLEFYMHKVGIGESVIDKITKSGAGTIAVTYGLYKIATPARYFVTLGGTTIAINNLKRWGYIRPAKEIYSNNREKIHKQIQRQRDKYHKKKE